MLEAFESEIETVVILMVSTLIASLVTKGMIALSILDHPEERSSHKMPLPTSGGVGIMAGFITFLLGYHFYVAPLITPPLLWILGGAFTLGAMGFIDEIIEISFLKRLAIQLIVSALIVTQAFPLLEIMSLKFIVLLILLGGFINAYNFFDGLDGLAGSSALMVALFAFFFFQGSAILYLALVPGLFGFLYWNYQGKIIQGDVGTFFTGLCLPSFLMLEHQDISTSILLMGHLFFPMLFDISVTIALRLLQGKSVTQPHKGFFFHQMNLKGWPHLKITTLYASFVLLQGVTAFFLNLQDPLTLTILYGANIVLYSILFWFLSKRPQP